jgi:hypothetical protein
MLVKGIKLARSHDPAHSLRSFALNNLFSNASLIFHCTYLFKDLGTSLYYGRLGMLRKLILLARRFTMHSQVQQYYLWQVSSREVVWELGSRVDENKQHSKLGWIWESLKFLEYLVWSCTSQGR